MRDCVKNKHVGECAKLNTALNIATKHAILNALGPSSVRLLKHKCSKMPSPV
jgi:hypothetical protein